MNLKLEILLLFLGGLLRIIDIGTDIWYLIQINYSTKLLWLLSIISLGAPSLILLLYYIVTSIKDLKNDNFSMTRFKIALLFILGDSFGLNYFVFSIILYRSSILSGDFFIIDSLFRATALLNSLLQSMPQIVFQAYNNQLIDTWDPFTVTSIGISFASLFYTIFKLVFAIDKIKQYEEVIKKNPNSEISGKNKIIPSQTENNDEDAYASI